MKTNSTWGLLIRTGRNWRALPIHAAILVMAALLVSCAGSGGGAGDAPEWIYRYPAEDGFYVGIGGSNTGNLAEDREKAAAAARADLAAQISTEVRSELDVISQSSTEEGFSEAITQTINESVEQNLQAVDTVDSWMSPEQGAWVYVRLSQAKWAAIVNREISDMTLRANTALQAVGAGTATEAEEMAALGRTRQSLLESPWGPRVKDEVLGSGGFLLEAVEAAIGQRGAGLVVRIGVSPEQTTYGQEVRIAGTVLSGAGRDLGTYPLIIDTADIEAIPLTTDPSGTYSLTLNSRELGLNYQQITVTPDLASWSIPSDRFAVTDATAELFIAPIPVSFRITNNTGAGLEQYSGDVAEWFSDLGLPVSINPPGAVEMDVEFLWKIEDFPESDVTGGFRFSNVGADIIITRGAEVVAVRSLDFIKDGGLNYTQAQERAARTLVSRLGANERLAAEMRELLDR